MSIIFLAWSIFVLFSVGTLLLLHTYLVIVGKTTYEFLNERNDREKKRKALAMSLKSIVSDNNSQENVSIIKPSGALTQPYLPICTNAMVVEPCTSTRKGASFHCIHEGVNNTSGHCIKKCIINPFAGSSMMFITTGTTTTTSSSTGSFTDTVSSHLGSICCKLRECLYLLLPEVG